MISEREALAFLVSSTFPASNKINENIVSVFSTVGIMYKCNFLNFFFSFNSSDLHEGNWMTQDAMKGVSYCSILSIRLTSSGRGWVIKTRGILLIFCILLEAYTFTPSLPSMMGGDCFQNASLKLSQKTVEWQKKQLLSQICIYQIWCSRQLAGFSSPLCHHLGRCSCSFFCYAWMEDVVRFKHPVMFWALWSKRSLTWNLHHRPRGTMTDDLHRRFTLASTWARFTYISCYSC